MIVDCHTHIFPPEVIAQRERFVAADPLFAALYATPAAKLATAEDLLGSMQRSGVAVSLALGFAWRDPALCRLHNDYLLAAAAASAGRLRALCSLPLACADAVIEAEAGRCLAAGAIGFGELRPEDQGCDLAVRGSLLGKLAAGSGAVLLFHASEPVGHLYPGKRGLGLEPLYRFIEDNPEARLIAAHWGGGLPFYALMPEVRAALANVRFDTAASSLLYTPDVFSAVARLTGIGSILFGSDYPLLSQARCVERVRQAGLSPSEVELALGGNAAAWLGLS